MTFVFASYLSFLSITFPSFFFLSLGPLYFYLLLLLLPMSPPHITLFSLSLLQSILIPYSYLLSCVVLTSLFPILRSFPPAGHPIPSPALGIVNLFNFSRFGGCKVVSQWGFNLHFPDD